MATMPFADAAGSASGEESAGIVFICLTKLIYK